MIKNKVFKSPGLQGYRIPTEMDFYEVGAEKWAKTPHPYQIRKPLM